MTIVQVEDTRNVEWRANNKGSALLQKMGWSEGKGIGKRNANTTALKAVKRQEGLGLGAKMEIEGGQSESTNTFAAVLKNLQGHHAVDEKKKAKKEKKAAKKKKKGLILPQNKVTAGHAQKMRQAKFGEKSADDLACIFGNKNAAAGMTMPVIPAPVSDTSSAVDKKEKKRKAKKERKKRGVEEEGASERKEKKRKLNKEETRSSKKEKKRKSKES